MTHKVNKIIRGFAWSWLVFSILISLPLGVFIVSIIMVNFSGAKSFGSIGVCLLVLLILYGIPLIILKSIKKDLPIISGVDAADHTVVGKEAGLSNKSVVIILVVIFLVILIIGPLLLLLMIGLG